MRYSKYSNEHHIDGNSAWPKVAEDVGTNINCVTVVISCLAYSFHH